MFPKFCDRRRWRSSASVRKLPPSNLSLHYLWTTTRPDERVSLLRPGTKTVRKNVRRTERSPVFRRWKRRVTFRLRSAQVISFQHPAGGSVSQERGDARIKL